MTRDKENIESVNLILGYDSDGNPIFGTNNKN